MAFFSNTRRLKSNEILQLERWSQRRQKFPHSLLIIVLNNSIIWTLRVCLCQVPSTVRLTCRIGSAFLRSDALLHPFFFQQ